eukprot:CAMPEP_0119553790 /NCGR_PEP_ID=MMETSP1352-20130426/6455_1 /TAXON_ID=265584 /ORGANISM="Stauroneis constricta, Strain CCMP1120" /LENGTH=142 /DNA_ID=CAMNT_0007600265 /DNA_START=33 /DNA_END=461 /DNA_ORIENTATION=-
MDVAASSFRDADAVGIGHDEEQRQQRQSSNLAAVAGPEHSASSSFEGRRSISTRTKLIGLALICVAVVSFFAARNARSSGTGRKSYKITWDESKAREADEACIEKVFGFPQQDDCACFDDGTSLRCKCDCYMMTQLKGGDCD